MMKTSEIADNLLIQDEKIQDAIIELSSVSKIYGKGKRSFTALNKVSIHIPKNQFVFVQGRSGSGKSTLLNMISGIDRPSKGDITINNTNLNTLNENDLAIWRGKNIGIVFQFFQLIPTLTIVENIMLPMDFCNVHEKKERKSIALALLDKVGILDQANKFPSKLSGGQQQRAAIARSLATDPDIIIADEPTGNLDSYNAQAVYKIFDELIDAGKTVIVVTHEVDFPKNKSRIIALQDGKILNDSINS